MSTTAKVPPAEQPAAPETVPEEPAPGRQRSLFSAIEPLLRRLHFYVGVLVAPFLMVAALTGLLYTITPQLDQIAYHDQLHVAEVGTSTVPLAEQVAAAQAVVPDGTVTLVAPRARRTPRPGWCSPYRSSPTTATAPSTSTPTPGRSAVN
jgi:uncharacterized iron-regulated membrane protein